MDTAERTSFIDRFLTAVEDVRPEDAEQHGVKGQKWGVRKAPGSGPGPASEVTIKTAPGRRVKTSGGKANTPHEDAVKAAVGRQIAKKSTVDALSNQELQAVITRMQLESNYNRLNKENVSAGRKFINKFLGDKKTRANTAEYVDAGRAVFNAAKVGQTITNTKL